MTENKVWVLVISHEYGENVTVHRTRESAERQLLGYVDDYWVDSGYGNDPPEDAGERIDAYFEDGEEGYIITETTICE